MCAKARLANSPLGRILDQDQATTRWAIPDMQNVGEFLSLLGAFRVNTVVATLAATGVVLGAAYMLLLYRKVIFGSQVNADAAEMKDLDRREFGYFIPFVLLVIWLGVSPGYILDRIAPASEKLVADYQAAIAETASTMPDNTLVDPAPQDKGDQ